MAEKIEPVFDGRLWRGMSPAYGMHFVIELFPSVEHPGYYHISVAGVTETPPNADVTDTKRPIRADGVPMMLKIALKREGLCMADVTWQELPDNAALMLAHPELHQSNDKA